MLGLRQDNARVLMAVTQFVDNVLITSTNIKPNSGLLQIQEITMPCIIGLGGIGQKQGEGDSVTPVSRWTSCYFLYRSDRIKKPRSPLPGFAVNPTDSWCDSSFSRRYNLPLGYVSDNSNEALWRFDNLYDVILILNHNTHPTIKGRGSAIFIHTLNKNSRFTQGCVALSHKNIRKLLLAINQNTCFVIT